ncbi:putative MAPEG superfamily protein [Pseudomonas sp. JUb42]|uniref:MAPEG family protein n=1 Tax=Pseudomonas sp. JUb42 TaxID=2940611 RepID=UPI00216940AF|nr:MAPEG family protein [Pseudomonas sp. JUb42]MCS3468904.1 putative MAPEG superfamily protein [Pseudomonas sp. JUb42]
MSSELVVLSWVLFLGIAHLFVSISAAALQQGLSYTFGARDRLRSLSGRTARLQRSLSNFLETLPFFIGAVVVAGATGQHGGLVLLGSQVYLLARIVYVPIYMAGIPVLRTLAWLAGTIGIVLVLVGAS